jgi:hypothetical protein
VFSACRNFFIYATGKFITHGDSSELQKMLFYCMGESFHYYSAHYFYYEIFILSDERYGGFIFKKKFLQ